MAGKGITKQIRLIATLDDSAFKRQIADLKKSLGKDLSFGGADLSELRNSFKSIAKEFSKELKEALNSVSKVSGRTGISGRNDTLIAGSTNRDALKKDAELTKEFRKRLTGVDKEEKLRQKYLDSSIGTLLTRFGVKAPTAIGVARAAEQGGSLGLKARAAASGINSVMAGGLAGGMAIAGGVVAGTAVAAQSYLRSFDTQRAFRTAASQKEFEGTRLTMQGRALESAIRKGGRAEGERGLEGFLGGAKEVVTSPMALLGGLLRGRLGAQTGELFKKGRMERGEAEAETRLQETAPAMSALGSARGMRQARVSALTGGGISGGALSGIQQRGTEFGFSPEETLSQFISARSSLGNKGAGQGLGTLQGLNRSFGVDVGESARASEIFGGSSGNGMAAGVASTVEVLKKGVASGLDASKSGQFLKMTADFVQSQTGFASLNPEDIADKLARSAFQFARGGEVSQVQLQQAQSMQEMIRQSSSSTEGLAGGANISGVMREAQKAGINLDPFQLLALSRSSNLGEGAIKDVLGETGASPEQIAQATKGIAGMKNSMPEEVQKMLFGEGGVGLSKGAFAMQESGFAKTTEEAQGLLGARGFAGPMSAGAAPGMVGGPEMESLRAEAKVNQATFVEGLKLLGDDTKAVSDNLKDLSKQVRDAAAVMREFAGAVSRDKR